MILIVRIPTHRLRIPSSKMENPTNTIIIAAASNGLIKNQNSDHSGDQCDQQDLPPQRQTESLRIYRHLDLKQGICQDQDSEHGKIRSTAKFFLAIRITPTAISRIPKARSN